MSVSKVPSSFKDETHRIRAHPNPVGLHLNLVTSAETLFPNKVTFTNSGLGLQHIFLRTTWNTKLIWTQSTSSVPQAGLI